MRLWAAFIAGPLAWFASQQLSLALVDTACQRGRWLEPAITVLLALALGAGVLVSVRERRAVPGNGTRSFVVEIGVLAAAVFLAAMLWQLSASLLYSGCER